MPWFELLDVESVKLIPYMVIIPVAVHVQDLCDALEAGRSAEPVAVAKVGGNMYAIDNIDAFLAHRKTGAKTMPCAVREVGSVWEAILAHVLASIKFPVHPIRYGETVDVACKELGYGRPVGLDAEYMRIHELGLDPGAKERMKAYIDGLGDRVRHIPSFYHIFGAISKIALEKQLDTVKMIIRYCDRMSEMNRTLTIPDPNNICNILQQYPRRTAKPRVSKTSGNVVKDEMKVKLEEGEPGYYHDPDTNNIDLRCECGMEYVVDTRKNIIWNREEKENMVVLSGDYGDPVYPVRKDVADFMRMESKQSVYYYKFEAKGPRRVVVMCSNPLAEERQEQIRQLFAGWAKEDAGGPGKAL